MLAYNHTEQQELEEQRQEQLIIIKCDVCSSLCMHGNEEMKDEARGRFEPRYTNNHACLAYINASFVQTLY